MNESEKILQALANLPDDVEITITVKAGAARRALVRAETGPEWLSTVQCSELVGGSAREWREWCEQGVIADAKKDRGGRWRLPNAAARAHYDRHLNGEKPSRASGPAGMSTPRLQPHARGRRGPRKATLAAVPGGKS